MWYRRQTTDSDNASGKVKRDIVAGVIFFAALLAAVVMFQYQAGGAYLNPDRPLRTLAIVVLVVGLIVALVVRRGVSVGLPKFTTKLRLSSQIPLSGRRRGVRNSANFVSGLSGLALVLTIIGWLSFASDFGWPLVIGAAIGSSVPFLAIIMVADYIAWRAEES